MWTWKKSWFTEKMNLNVFLFLVKYAVMSLQKLHCPNVFTLDIFKGNLFASLKVAVGLRRLKSEREDGSTGLNS